MPRLFQPGASELLKKLWQQGIVQYMISAGILCWLTNAEWDRQILLRYDQSAPYLRQVKPSPLTDDHMLFCMFLSIFGPALVVWRKQVTNGIKRLWKQALIRYLFGGLVSVNLWAAGLDGWLDKTDYWDESNITESYEYPRLPENLDSFFLTQQQEAELNQLLIEQASIENKLIGTARPPTRAEIWDWQFEEDGDYYLILYVALTVPALIVWRKCLARQLWLTLKRTCQLLTSLIKKSFFKIRSINSILNKLSE